MFVVYALPAGPQGAGAVIKLCDGALAGQPGLLRRVFFAPPLTSPLHTSPQLHVFVLIGRPLWTGDWQNGY